MIGRQTNYRDPEGFGRTTVSFADPLERAAIVLLAMRASTPADAVSQITGQRGQSELAVLWARLEPAERQLWRRRADAVVDVYTTFGATVARSDEPDEPAA